jgi:hypothetical protein
MRRIPLSRRSHVTGYGCFGSGAIEHESALERDFVILTSFADPGAVIVSQPVTIRFEDEGCQRRYTPDFSVRWSDGRFELVEVKYRTICGRIGHYCCRASRLRVIWRANAVADSALRPTAVFAASGWKTPSDCCRLGERCSIPVSPSRRCLPPGR